MTAPVELVSTAKLSRGLKCLDPNIYTVVMSAAMSVPQAVAGMHEGANDCEVTPVAPRHL